VNNLLDVKENDEHAFPLGGLLLCLRAITINPALITSDNPGQEGCIIGGYIMKLLADVDTLLLLINCQIQSHQQGLEQFDVDPHERAVEVWLHCWALWS
jgi:hypothetical protein